MGERQIVIYYIVYKTTNLVNNKIYVGKHISLNLDDTYLGSGIALIKAVKKYGKKNFRRENLYNFDTEEEMNKKEAEIVDKDFVKRKDTYNLRVGGVGNFSHINFNKEFYIKRGPDHPSYNKTLEEIMGVEKAIKYRQACKERATGKNNPMYGKPGGMLNKKHKPGDMEARTARHWAKFEGGKEGELNRRLEEKKNRKRKKPTYSKEALERKRIETSLRFKGQPGPTKGYIWIHNLITKEVKYVPEMLPGFVKGRVIT